MSRQNALRCPEEILERLPWYVDESLPVEQRDLVEAHAAECPECRAEIEMLSGREQSPATGVPQRDEIYARSLGLIEAYELALPRESQDAAVASATSRRQKPWPMLAMTASVMIAFGVGALVGLWGGSSGDPGAPVYRTATDVAAVPGAVEIVDTAQLDVMFRGDATAARIRSALRAIGGKLVDGPSRLGVYRVRLGEDGDASAAAAMLLGEGKGVAAFAEPVQN